MSSWRPTAAVLRVGVLPAGIALVAVLAGRPDLLLVAAPLLVAGLPLLSRPPGCPATELTVSPAAPGEGDEARALVRVTGLAGAESVTATVATPGWLRSPTGRPVAAVGRPTGEGTAELGFDLLAARWGRWPVGPARVQASACAGLLRWEAEETGVRRVPVLPLSQRYRGSGEVPRARGGIGLHRSRRPGEGSELSGIRAFTAGDRMRRVNWRVSLRAGELHVNATTSERDADVVLLVDARFDAGVSGGVQGQASGVDVAVRAAGELAASALRLGDRVGLQVTSSGTRTVPARSGRGHLQALLRTLLDVAPPPPSGTEPALPEPIAVDPRALVLVLSPLVGRQVFDRAAALGRGGHAVVVVDTLPADAAPVESTAWTAAALRLWRLERDTRVGQLRALGVPVVPWRGSGSLDPVLAELGRVAARTGVRR